jgi:protein O-GlcNAc transferase
VTSLAAAIELWRMGRGEEAGRACEAILTLASDDPEALTLLAEIQLARGNPLLAADGLQRLTRLRPGDPAAHRRLGDAMLAARSYEPAAAAFRRSVALEPSARAYNRLGQALLAIGQLADAISSQQVAVTLDPNYAIGHCNLGLSQAAGGNLVAAVASYQRAIALQPTLIQAHHNCGRALRRLQQPQQALACFESARALQAGSPELALDIASTLVTLGRAEEALACCNDAIALRPDSAEARAAAAAALRALHRYADALASCERALQLDPRCTDAWGIRGMILALQGDRAAALNCFRRALDADPNCIEARARLLSGCLPLVAGSEQEVLQSRQDLAAELERFEDWVGTSPSAEAAIGAVDGLFYLAYQPHCNRELHSHHGRLCARLMSGIGLPPAPPRSHGSRIRVGIVSAHVFDHAVYRALLRGWLQHLPRERFELQIFSLGDRFDQETAAARELADEFLPGPALLHDWIAAIRARNPDVLLYPEVGMDALTMRLASLRLARHQLAAWGHPDTTGLPTIDYYLSAEAFEPPAAEEHYSERLVRLPNTGVHYETLGIEPALPDAGPFAIDPTLPILLCPGTPFKYSPQHDDVLIEIARRVGPCQFVFFSYREPVLSERLRARLAAAFGRCGLRAADYLKMLPWQSRQQFFGWLHTADAMLDTIGFSGFNTVMQAVECGLPCVTFEGPLMRGRFGSGLMRQAGLPELATSHLDEYVEMAARLAGDRDYRNQIAGRLRLGRVSLFRNTAAIEGLTRFMTGLQDRRG